MTTAILGSRRKPGLGRRIPVWTPGVGTGPAGIQASWTVPLSDSFSAALDKGIPSFSREDTDETYNTDDIDDIDDRDDTDDTVDTDDTGLSEDFLGTFRGLSENFLKTFWALSGDFLRTF